MEKNKIRFIIVLFGLSLTLACSAVNNYFAEQIAIEQTKTATQWTRTPTSTPTPTPEPTSTATNTPTLTPTPKIFAFQGITFLLNDDWSIKTEDEVKGPCETTSLKFGDRSMYSTAEEIFKVNYNILQNIYNDVKISILKGESLDGIFYHQGKIKILKRRFIVKFLESDYLYIDYEFLQNDKPNIEVEYYRKSVECPEEDEIVEGMLKSFK
jgi:hypothetical protein